MDESDWLAGQFEEHRIRLRAVAYRMLGSLSEADDAVQESWLRLSRSDPAGIANLGGWLTTVVARVCLNMLRSRKSRREEPTHLVGFARPALVNGAAGIVAFDPHGQPFSVMGFTVRRGKIVAIDILADPARLRRLDLTVLESDAERPDLGEHSH